MSTRDPAPTSHAIEESLLHLRRDLFGDGMPLARTDTLRTPVELTPQFVLQWISCSSVCSLDPEFASKVAQECIRLGANPMHTNNTAAIRRAGINLGRGSLPQPFGAEPVERSLAEISPLGSAIYTRNTPALTTYLDLGALSGWEPSARVARIIDASRARTWLDAWSFCAVLGRHGPMPALTSSFGILKGDLIQEQRLGVALCHLLDGRVQHTLHPTDGVPDLRRVGRCFLVAGASPEPLQLHQIGIDPAWLLGLVCEHSDLDDLNALRRLLSSGLSPNPADGRVLAPLHLAAQRGNAAALLALLNSGADAQAKDRGGRTLEQAVHADERSEIINILRVWTARKFALDVMGLFDAFRRPPDPAAAKLRSSPR